MSQRDKYKRDSRKWIADKQCKVCADVLSEMGLDDHEAKPAEQIHHMKGRQGYADNNAYSMNISLVIDTRFWLPVCASHHDYIHRNITEAMEKGYTQTRSDIIFK